jgi:hypothetical protein
MANPIVEKLRQAIDAKYAEALANLEKLAIYMDDVTIEANGKSPKNRQPPRTGTGKIRPAVLAVFREGSFLLMR